MGVFMKVSEIFKSIEGEGIRMGQAAVFVRLHGCNLRCSYCDSMYAVEGPDFKLMSVMPALKSTSKQMARFLANGSYRGCSTRWTGSAKAAACRPE